VSNTCGELKKHFELQLKAPIIPNIITPNGDSKNEYFVIENLASQSNLLIKNRWGQEVFQSQDYQNNWPQNNINDGIFYYELIHQPCYERGWIQVVR
jgi:gliding motility-associated-like protein